MQKSSSTAVSLYNQYPTGKIPKGEFCEACARYNARHIAVGTVVLNSKHEVLLIQRNIEPSKGMWALPGGYLDWEETVEQAAIREVFEETGIRVDRAEFFKVYSEPHREDNGKQNVIHTYIAYADVEPTVVSDEVSDIRWFAVDALPPLAFNHDQVIREVVHYTDDVTTLKRLKTLVHDFRTRRGWIDEDPKDLALSLVLESSELLEHFQWLSGKEVLDNPRIKEAIGEEMSDVLWWIIDLAHTLDLDIATVFAQKMQKNAHKYPEELFHVGISKEEQDKAYYKIKAATRGGHPLYIPDEETGAHTDDHAEEA